MSELGKHERSWLSAGASEDRRELLHDVKQCNEAGDYENFRTIESLCRNVSGVNVQRAQKEFDYICKQNRSIITKNIAELLSCDLFGNPHTYNFSNRKLSIDCSDSVITPVYTIVKLEETFDSLDPNMDVVEIGCGFGIETKVYHDLVGYNTYTHVDIPDMLKLQSAYLSYFGINNIDYINPYEDMDKVKDSYDLFISNFAYTEISYEVQKLYFNDIISKCRRGIIIGKIRPEIQQCHGNCISKPQLDWFDNCFNIKLQENNTGYRGGILYFWK